MLEEKLLIIIIHSVRDWAGLTLISLLHCLPGSARGMTELAHQVAEIVEDSNKSQLVSLTG